MRNSRGSALLVLVLVGIGVALLPQGALAQPSFTCPAGWTKVNVDLEQQASVPMLLTGTGNVSLTLSYSDTNSPDVLVDALASSCISPDPNVTPCVAGGLLGGLGGTNNLQILMLTAAGRTAPVTMTGTFARASAPHTVANLTIWMTDVDCHSATPDTPNAACNGGGGGAPGWSDRLTVTTTSQGGDPTLTALTGTPSFTISGNTATGDGASPNAATGSSVGNLQAQFSQNVENFTIAYSNAGNNSGAQGYATKWISYCDYVNPNEALVTDVSAIADGGEAVLEWKTASEVGPVGFHVLRLDPRTREYVRVNDELIASLAGSPQGGTYRLMDRGARVDREHTYKIVEVRADGSEVAYGPYAVSAKPARAVEPIGGAERAELARNGYQQAAHPLNAVVPSAKASGIPESYARAAATEKHSGLKIGVREDGLYALTSAEIASALGSPEPEVRAQIRNRLLQLRNRGAEVAWRPMADGAGLLFYGQGPDSVFTADNVYRLDRSLLYRGLQMPVRKAGSSSPSSNPTTFADQQHREQDQLFVTVLQALPDSDIAYWDAVSGTAGKTFALYLDGVAAVPGVASLRVNGRSWFAQSDVQVSVNGTVIGLGPAQSSSEFALDISFPQELLVSGDNQVKVERLAPQGVSSGAFFVDSFDVTYRRTARAVSDALLVRSDGSGIATVAGFTAPGIHVLDVSQPERPAYVVGAAEDDLDGYRASFPTSASGRSFLVVSPTGIRKAAWLKADVPSNLKDSRNEAAYLVVAPGAFANAAAQFADYRRTLGSKVIDVEDVYDEFSDSLADPRAIQAFLAHAYRTWRTPPRYVLLLGNGTYDYKNALGLGDGFLPPLLANPGVGGLFASDNALADVNGDGIPEMAIGRLPIRTSAEAEAYLAKLRTQESAAGAWAENAILASDTSDAFDYGAESHATAELLPASYQKTFAALSEISLTDARTRLIGGINAGAGVVNYLGHGGTDRLSAMGLLTNEDVSSLTNTGKLPVVSALTCVINRFEMPGFAPLGAKLVLAPNAGAIAVWAPTGESMPANARILNENLFREYQQGGRPVGDAVLQTMRTFGQAGYSADLLRIYTLLGDPAARLPVR